MVIGKGVAALADELAGYQLDEVMLIEHDLLEEYTPDGYCIALRQEIESAKPDLVLLPHTYQVRDFAPKLAASMRKGMIGDCIAYRYENGKLIFVRQMFQGRTAADVVFTGEPPWIASFQAGAFRADTAAKRSSGKAASEGGGRRTEAGADSHQAAGAFPRSQASGGSDAGAHFGFRGTRDQSARKYSHGGKAGQTFGRGNFRVAPYLRRRLAADGPPDRQLRADGGAEALSRARASAAPSSTWWE